MQGALLSEEEFYYDGNGNCTFWSKKEESGISNVRNFFGPCNRIECSIENIGTSNEASIHYEYNEFGEPLETESSSNFEKIFSACQHDEEENLNPQSTTPATVSNPIPKSLIESYIKSAFENLKTTSSRFPIFLMILYNGFLIPDPTFPDKKESVSWLRWTLNHLLSWKEINDVGIIGQGRWVTM